MKIMMSLCALLWASSAFAADEPEPKAGDDKSIEKQGGKFSLLGTECKAEEDALETVPGSPPLDVDDTGTPGCNGWEINVVTSGELGKATSLETPLFDINYGIGDNIQLKAEIPYLVNRVDGASSGGVGSGELGIKHRFFEDESRDLSIAVYPQLEFAVPGTAAEYDEGTVFKLPVLMSTRVSETSKGDIMLTANLGYNVSSNADTGHYLSGALGIGFPLSSRIAMMIEASTEQALGNNMAGVRDSVFKANAALVGRLNSHFMVFGAVGESYASAEEEDSTHTCLLLGIRVLAGGP
jgi:hypothetical protein